MTLLANFVMLAGAGLLAAGLWLTGQPASPPPLPAPAAAELSQLGRPSTAELSQFTAVEPGSAAVEPGLPAFSPENATLGPVARQAASPALKPEPDRAGELRIQPTGAPTRLVIPAIGVDATIVEVGLRLVETESGSYLEWETAAHAVGWHDGSAQPGEAGNTVLSGHNNILGEVFRRLSELRQGDVILAYSGDRLFRYRVRQAFIVPEAGRPSEVRRTNARWIAATDDERLTLVSCWPYRSNTHRVLVIAVPEGEGITEADGFTEPDALTEPDG